MLEEDLTSSCGVIVVVYEKISLIIIVYTKLFVLQL